MREAEANPSATGKFLDALDGKAAATPPVWLMRQAGRYLPEYREIRAKAPSFIDFCFNPDLATEATLQPIRRFDFDAAILFADILLIPAALGQAVSFEQGEGPRLPPLESFDDIRRLNESVDLAVLAPVFETIRRVRKELPADKALIGFCGAPWTVASYMIAGHGTPDQAPARLFAYRHPEAFQELIDRLVDASVAYLGAQIRAGVEAVQIFDSWAGVLPAGEFERWCLEPTRAIVARLRNEIPEARIIAFPRGAGGSRLCEIGAMEGVSALGLDTAVDPAWAAEALIDARCLQGNLDPLALLAGGAALDRGIDRILEAFGQRAHIFNLGHGILPATPIAHVERLVARLRGSHGG